MGIVEDLMKQIGSAKNTYIKAYNGIDEATKAHNANIYALKKQIKELTKEAYSNKWNTEQASYNAILRDINNALSEEIEKVKEAYESIVYNYYQPSGSAIVEDDVKLLNSGIILSSAELERMIAKNADNLTMIRLIEQYKNNNKIKVSEDVEIACTRAKKAGNAEFAAFNTFMQLAGNCVRMALQGMAGSETYIKCADSLEDYVKDTERKLLKAKVFLDENTRSELLKLEEAMNADKNATMGTKNINYN